MPCERVLRLILSKKQKTRDNPGLFAQVDELSNYASACEVICNANLIQNGRQAMGEVDIGPGATAIWWACLAARKPVLVIHPKAEVDVFSDLGINSSTEGKEVIARGGACLIEVRCEVERAATRRTPQVRIIATIGAMVPHAVFKCALLRRGVLLDINLVVVQFSAPMRGEVKGAVHTKAESLLGGVVWVAQGKGGSYLKITRASGVW